MRHLKTAQTIIGYVVPLCSDILIARESPPAAPTTKPCTMPFVCSHRADARSSVTLSIHVGRKRGLEQNNFETPLQPAACARERCMPCTRLDCRK